MTEVKDAKDIVEGREQELILDQIAHVAEFTELITKYGLSDDGCDALIAASDLLTHMANAYSDGPGSLLEWLNDETENGAVAVARRLSCEGPSEKLAEVLTKRGWA